MRREQVLGLIPARGGEQRNSGKEYEIFSRKAIDCLYH